MGMELISTGANILPPGPAGFFLRPGSTSTGQYSSAQIAVRLLEQMHRFRSVGATPQSLPSQDETKDFQTQALLELRWAKDQLGLNVSELARLFGYSRKSLYDWFDNGVMPRRSVALRMQLFADGLRNWVDPQHMGSISNLLDTPTGNSSQTLTSILSREMPLGAANEALRIALVELNANLKDEAKARQSAAVYDGDAHISDII